MNEMGKEILLVLFITYIFVIGLYLMIMPKNLNSSIENRRLAQRPNFELEKVYTGEFMPAFENFFSDQFPGRDVWLNFYVNWQRLSNKTYISNFNKSDDNWMMSRPVTSFPKDKTNESSEKLNEFADYLNESGISSYYISLPHKALNIEFLYPEYLGDSTYDKINDFFYLK